jgi:O-phosphoseryl-tRNA(Sec) kinase
MTQFLLVLCGIPASGKTTLAKQLVTTLRSDYNVELVSTDYWRDDVYYSDFKPENERKVRAIALQRTKELLSTGHSVVHDDSNYYESMRHDLYNLAAEQGCAFGVIHVATPINVALRWNLLRDQAVPTGVVEQISERFDIPGLKYSWDMPIARLDMSTIGPQEAISEIRQRVLKLVPILLEAKPSPGCSEEYDKYTRDIVCVFLEKEPALQNNPEVSRIRREVLRQAIRDNQPMNTVRTVLWERLERLVTGIEK